MNKDLLKQLAARFNGTAAVADGVKHLADLSGSAPSGKKTSYADIGRAADKEIATLKKKIEGLKKEVKASAPIDSAPTGATGVLDLFARLSKTEQLKVLREQGALMKP